MVRQLPIILIEGESFFVDERLKEYRHVENPHHRIRFEGFSDRPAKLTAPENKQSLIKKESVKQNRKGRSL